MPKGTRRITAFSVIVMVVALVDLLAKEIAAVVLADGPMTIEALGRSLRFELMRNELSAFSVSLGPLTRELNVIATGAAILLAVPASERLRALDSWGPVALALIAGAALGNLVSMLTSPAGVVDFITLPLGGYGVAFNLADMAAYLGLVLLTRPVATICRLILLERRAAASAS